MGDLSDHFTLDPKVRRHILKVTYATPRTILRDEFVNRFTYF
jgi:hypothetical protein